MGAEIGCTTSVFPFNVRMSEYLNATNRAPVAQFAELYQKDLLRADEGAEYDQIIEIDLNTLEPYVNGPFTPDLATPISKLKDVAVKNDWPLEVKVGLIGSCTNSSYEDMSRSASIVLDAKSHGLKAKSIYTVTPVLSRSVLPLSVTVSSRPSLTLVVSFLLTLVAHVSVSGIVVISRRVRRTPLSPLTTETLPPVTMVTLLLTLSLLLPNLSLLSPLLVT